MPESSSELLIVEATGRARTVRLTGRGLPRRPLQGGTHHRVEVTRPAGERRGSSTALGPDYPDTTIGGMWSDKWLDESIQVASSDTNRQAVSTPMTLDGESVRTAQAAVRLFESIVEEGQVIEFQWGPFARRGHLKEFDYEWLNGHDARWTMHFVWLNPLDVDSSTPATSSTAGRDVDNSANEVRGATQRLDDAAEPTFPIDTDFLASINNFVLATINNSVAVIDAATSAAQGDVPQLDTIRNAASSLGSLSSSARGLCAALRNQPEATYYAAREPASLAFGERMAAIVWGRTLQARARDVDRLATIRREELLRDVGGEILAVHEAIQGEDVRDIARTYYGAIDQWRLIYVYNGLTTTELSAGDIVFVPRMDGAQ